MFDGLAALLDPGDLELLKKNSKAAFFEPLVGAAAHALAAVLDRVRHGTIPESSAPDAIVQQAATLASSLAAKPDAWPEFRAQLHRSAGQGSQVAGARRDRARLDGEVEDALIDALLPQPGDPAGRRRRRPGHRRSRSIRCIRSGSSAGCSTASRRGLRRAGADGYGGGILLFAALAAVSAGRASTAIVLAADEGRRRDRAGSRRCSSSTAFWRSATCFGMSGASSRRWPPAISTPRATRIAALVGRDVDRMDAAACRRAAIESLSENLTDGFTSPLVWYAVAGLARPRAVQGRQHDGLDGRLQDAAVSAVRLVRRAARRCDELRAGAADVAADCGGRRGVAVLLGPQGVSHRSPAARDPARARIQDGAKRPPPGESNGASSGRSGCTARS